MAARGAEAKEKITKKLLETFEGAFKYDKEIRIPILENGEIIQIKCVLTAAKVNVEMGGDTAMPGGTSTPVAQKPKSDLGKVEEKTLIEPTAEEKATVSQFLKTMGF